MQKTFFKFVKFGQEMAFSIFFTTCTIFYPILVTYTTSLAIRPLTFYKKPYSTNYKIVKPALEFFLRQ